VAESRFCEQKGRLHDDFDALFEDRLGESGILLSIFEFRKMGSNLSGAWSRGVVFEVSNSAFGLRDDCTGDTDHVVGSEVDPVSDLGGEIVTRLDFGYVCHSE